MESSRIIDYIVKDLGLDEFKVNGVLSLLAKGATVPFIARYRKEQTGGIDEVQIRNISDKFTYYAELEAAKLTAIKSIESQGRMTEDLKKKISECRQKFVLEDIYLPYKPRPRTRATIAREKGLDELAQIILSGQLIQGAKRSVLERYTNPSKGVLTPESALEDALEIVIEHISEDAEIRSALRELCRGRGVLISKVVYALAGTKTKYEAYYNFSELIAKTASHRLLAIRRGTKEKILNWEIDIPENEVFKLMQNKFCKNKQSIFHADLLRAIDIAYRRTLKMAIEVDVLSSRLTEAEKEAILVFAKNLRNLLLAPPAGRKVIMGVDPGIATGAKLAVMGTMGELKEYAQIFLHASERAKAEAGKVLTDLVKKHNVELIATGNGTGSKETFAFIKDIVKENSLDVKPVMVSEAGASVYSASDAARAEFPELDITIRGAISIARRLQDPLADLIKIDPKSIGVGQYQHDVSQSLLKKELDATIESCVNYVGVELNTASSELLTHVSGIGPTLAASIVAYRKRIGPFKTKKDLLKVPLLGEKAFEQCAGFLKVRESINPLDNSSIHPERYQLIESMAADIGADIGKLIGNEEIVSKIDINKYVSETAGIPTLTDIVKELKKPGLDPRKEFDSVEFSQTINELGDVSPGMVLNGIVTNVTNFGAFVDIGVHQDGLMHISNMSDRFVKDPHTVVAVGNKIKVKIISVDKALGRIGLEMHTAK
ncbi:MAG: Tex family protein [Candidatus Omnitrophota bacterium]